MQEWVPTTVCLLILFWTKDAWTIAHEPFILCLEPLIGLLVMVVWRDMVIATPFPSLFSTRLNNAILTGLNLHAKHDFLEKVTLKV